jgi:hypothetical protein
MLCQGFFVTRHAKIPYKLRKLAGVKKFVIS